MTQKPPAADNAAANSTRGRGHGARGSDDVAPSDGARPEQNKLLASLKGDQRARILTQLELVPLKLGQVICEAGEPFDYAYFPTAGIVSILYVMENDASAEIAVVGNEGMVGVALFMGGESTLSRAIVQNAGHAYRLAPKQLQAECARGGVLQTVLLQYAHTLIAQMVQTAACNRHHGVDQQLCRWLLMSLDRLPSNQLHMTRRLIGNMLGISVSDVDAAAAILEQAGLIRFDSGNISVVDRAAVERRSCECYAVVKRECDRIDHAAAAAAA